jgi:preprotein translocase SecE subunit
MTDRKKNVSRSQQATQVRPQDAAQTSTAKAARTSARDERREPARSASKTTARRDSRGTSLYARARNTKIGRFIYEAYYELRHKVTWPTFQEAKNMTIMVIVISAVLGGLLSLVDAGLLHLFSYIINGKW